MIVEKLSEIVAFIIAVCMLIVICYMNLWKKERQDPKRKLKFLRFEKVLAIIVAVFISVGILLCILQGFIPYIIIGGIADFIAIGMILYKTDEIKEWEVSMDRFEAIHSWYIDENGKLVFDGKVIEDDEESS